MKIHESLFWQPFAFVVSRPPIARALVRRAKRTPYFHLKGYMHRWWLFNPIVDEATRRRRWDWLPSMRVHHILRPDVAHDKHNHPRHSRTIILSGWYIEQRDEAEYLRDWGDTAIIRADTFHHISRVSPGGVWTLFITWKWRHTWGFRTADGFVPWRTYLGIDGPETGNEGRTRHG